MSIILRHEHFEPVGQLGDPPQVLNTYYRVKVFEIRVVDKDAKHYTGTHENENGQKVYDYEDIREVAETPEVNPIYQCDCSEPPAFMDLSHLAIRPSLK